MTNAIIQYALAGIIVACAVYLAVRAVWRALRGKPSALNACASCKIKDYCTRSYKNKTKNCDDKVAK